MRVVGLISSPRKGGNSEMAVKEIFKQLPDSWEKAMIDLNDLNIENCRACYSCVPEGAKCKIQDDLDFLVRNVKHADKVVIAAPTYMLGGHTQIKRILDRLISLVGDYRLFNNSDCVIVNSYGFYGWEGLSNEDLLLFAKKFHLNVIGEEVILATLPADSVAGENLEKLRALAKILENGQAEVKLTGKTGQDGPVGTVAGREVLKCPFCGSSALRVSPNGNVRCGLCAGEGKLVSGERGLQIEYDPDFNHHFTHASLDSHVDYLMEKKKLFLDTRKDIQALQKSYADIDCWTKPEDK